MKIKMVNPGQAQSRSTKATSNHAFCMNVSLTDNSTILNQETNDNITMNNRPEERHEGSIVDQETGLVVIRILLASPHQDLLSILDLGRLSITSNAVSLLFQECQVWKSLFQKASDANRVEYSGSHDTGNFLFTGHAFTTWMSEPGLLSCFSDPEESVIVNIPDGYKRALGCLLRKSCNRCLSMSGSAHPFTMERLCASCYDDDESLLLMSTSKAKEAFLLSDKDCNALPKVRFSGCTLSGKPCSHFLLLLSDVKATAFRKYGGADGLATKIQERKEAADERFRISQSTSKPQKKRSKIERISDYPADNPKNVRFWGDCLPIGTVVGDKTNMILDHSLQCFARGLDRGTSTKATWPPFSCTRNSSTACPSAFVSITMRVVCSHPIQFLVKSRRV